MHCPYCAFQCGMVIEGAAADPKIAGNSEFPVNKGALCIKGWTCRGDAESSGAAAVAVDARC